MTPPTAGGDSASNLLSPLRLLETLQPICHILRDTPASLFLPPQSIYSTGGRTAGWNQPVVLRHSSVCNQTRPASASSFSQTCCIYYLRINISNPVTFGVTAAVGLLEDDVGMFLWFSGTPRKTAVNLRRLQSGSSICNRGIYFSLDVLYPDEHLSSSVVH